MIDPANDRVEVFDLAAKSITPLKNAGGNVVRIPSLVTVKYSCTVPLEDKNSIFIQGGTIGTGYNKLEFFNGSVKEELALT